MKNEETVQGFPAMDITRRAKTNFYYSFLILPKPKRLAIETVYAFCRVVDDIVDGDFVTNNPRAELNHWRDEIDACFNGRRPGTELGRQLKDVLTQFPIPRHCFEDMISGMEMDLDRRRYATFSELEKYCYHVAGVTGLMCIEIFGYRHPSAREYALKLGTALQLVNIIRDLKEDAKRSRIYLPQDELERFGYSEKELLDGVYNRSFVELMEFQCARAHSYFMEAKVALHPSDRARMASAEIMGRIYHKLLERIEQANYNVFQQRLALSKWEKVTVAMLTYFGSVLAL